MGRRAFLGAAGASLLAFPGARRLEAKATSPFPVNFRRASPYERVFRYVDPGSDEFKDEKAAIALEERLARVFQGKEEFPSGLQSWTNQWRDIRSAAFFVLPEDLVRYEISLSSPAGLSYRTGLWRLPDFSLVSENSVSSTKPLFRDATAHVFSRAASFREQLLKGNTCWRARLDAAAGIDVYGNQGIAVGDIDNDGADEVYVCQGGGLPNRLYRFLADGTVDDITEQAGVGVLDETTCALFIDLRNSGHQDLIVLRASGPLLFLNRGDGTFREHPGAFRFKSEPRGSFTGMAAADYDRDGRVDVYLCCYVYFQSEDQYQFPAPYHDARNGPPNFMFRNRLTADGGVFEDVTQESGLNENNDRFSFAPAWCDFDGDGWPDLYVANDFGRNNLYRNRGGHFQDESAKAGVEDVGPGMSASWFDYDGDGRPDLYVSNMWTAAGQRITKDPAFKPAAGLEEAYRGHTKGNSLYRNRGDGTFQETGAAEGVEMGRWAWGSGAFDFDLDGSPEIYIATGMLTNPSSRDGSHANNSSDLSSFFWRQVVAKSPSTQRSSSDYEDGWSAINQLIRQAHSWCGNERNVHYARRNGKYRDCSGISGIDFADDSRSFAVTDFDGDGNLDILLKSRLGPQVRALQNDCGVGKPVVAISLEGTKSNRDAIGARVEVNGRAQWVEAGSGFLSQHTKRLYFAVSGQNRADAKIAWPSGITQDLADLEPGFRYHVLEGSSDVARAAFRPRHTYPTGSVVPTNTPEPADSWLLQPIPTPDKRRGPGFLLLYSGERPNIPASRAVEAIDLARQPEETAASYCLLRRYIFEYRTDLNLPLLLLLDAESRVRKLYSTLPPEQERRTDLARVDRSRDFALPFQGRYYSEPRRNYFKLGAAFYWAGYPDRALPYLEETVRNQPDNWKALLAIGRIHQQSGRLAEAIETFQKVSAIRPDYVPVLVNAGEAYARLNDSASAEKALNHALKLDPDCADAANQLGLLAASRENSEAARKWFQRAISSQRDHSGAINNLGVLYAKLGQTNDAIAAFRYGIETVPDDETLYLNLGRIYVMIGERERAREALTQLLERKPGNPVAVRALAELEGK